MVTNPVGVLTTTLSVGTAPGHAAPGAPTYTGVDHVTWFGCGPTTGAADLCLTGCFRGSVRLGCTVAHATFTAQECTGVDCVISGTATGSVTGGIALSVNWTRLGALAVVTTTGDVNGARYAALEVVGPSGLPCGGPLDARFAGFLVGT